MRFSLKTFLLTTTLLGAGCGMFVHFKNNNPEGLRRAISILTLIPILIGVKHTANVVDDKSRKRLWRKYAGVSGALMLATFLLPDDREVYRFVSNDALVGYQHAGQIDNFRVWDELERRLAANELSDLEVNSALSSLAVAMETAADEKNLAAGWLPGQRLNDPEHYIEQVSKRPNSSQTALARILDSYHKQAVVKATAVSSSKDPPFEYQLDILFGVAYWETFEFKNLRHCWTIQAVRLDGSAIEHNTNRNQSGGNHAQSSIRIPTAGRHRIEVDLVRSYNAVPNCMGYTDLNPSEWDRTTPQKTFTLSTLVSCGEGADHVP